MLHPLAEGFHRTERASVSRVVHGAPSLPFLLLVINVKANCVGLLELGQWNAVWEDGACLEEADVLPPELDCVGFVAHGGHSVLLGSQEEK
jgi:hypothetical protein